MLDAWEISTEVKLGGYLILGEQDDVEWIGCAGSGSIHPRHCTFPWQGREKGSTLILISLSDFPPSSPVPRFHKNADRQKFSRIARQTAILNVDRDAQPHQSCHCILHVPRTQAVI
jgi:hypothetical protein